MPQWLESCVKELLGQKDFYPKHKDRESLAYAICQKQHKEKSFPMRITKATMRDGGMYWQGIVSDDDWDKQEERLDVSIFHDFRQRLDTQRHKADYEPPFVSLSHYGRFEDHSGERGIIQDVWDHGKDCYADGWFHDDPLSKRCFEVVRAELEQAARGEKIEIPVRFSVAFLPEETTEEDGRTVYLKGILDHVALTRVPVNPRTGFTQAVEKSMTTKREDALSIVGEDAPDEVKEAIEQLDEKQHTEKSQAEDLVIKSDEELLEEDSPYTIEQDIVLRAMLEQAGVDKAELEEKAWSYGDKKSLSDSDYAWVEHGPGCEKKDGQTPQKCRHLPYKKGGKVDCAHVRAALQAIGGARSGKAMEGVPSSAKQKLRSALKGCQGEKAEVLETELSEYESGRIDGFNQAMDTLLVSNDGVNAMTEKVEEKQEAKASINLDAILEAVKPKEPEKPAEEQKADVAPPDELDNHLNLLRQVLAAEGEGRARKLQGAEAVLRSLAVHVSKTIDATTPPSPEDIASTFKSQVEEVIRPVMDKIAVLEAAVLGKRSDAPVSKALSFNISPESTLLAARAGTVPSGATSPISQMINESVGLPKDHNRQPVL